MQFSNLASLRRNQILAQSHYFILFWDNSVSGLSQLARAVKWNVRLSKSIYDEEYRKLIDDLRAERKAVGLTQQALADKLAKPQSFVAKVEGYERRLDVIEYVHWCIALKISASAILRLES
jgi:hypothetical protein